MCVIQNQTDLRFFTQTSDLRSNLWHVMECLCDCPTPLIFCYAVLGGSFSACQALRDSFLWNISVGEKMLSTNEELKEAIFAEFRTEDIVLQYFLIAIIHYL